ncbi:hypothetical protein [Anaerovorax sp. IOR16]|uniref:hypothetical protein n=1 Tax=Anaerovorax sp. IOR16 TaxID=2773458 RepID=UPI0019D01974|nr:hypothetical protein [Anaerovorax sp. IOR16]
MQIHYFQRYHTKENVDTSNVMLMLSRLYTFSSSKFFTFLKEFVFSNEMEPQLNFILQEKSARSIPDAVISQSSFKIVVETKLYNEFNLKQLVNHLQSFSTEDNKVLLTLDPRPMKKDLKDEFDFYLLSYNEKLDIPIVHCNMTFEGLVEGLKSVIDERDYEIMDVLYDFENYCFAENLIPDDYKFMRAMTAGTTLKDNLELNLYYDDAKRNFSKHAYIGLYSKKCIQAIGKIQKIIVVEIIDGELQYKIEEGQEIMHEELQNIKEAILRSRKYGYDLAKPHRYFLVDEFYHTNFKKSTPYPIQRAKYFDLKDILKCDELPSTDKIAKTLNKLEW